MFGSNVSEGLQAVWQPFFDAGLIAFRNKTCAAVLTNVFRIVANQAVALTSNTVLQLSRCREFEPLRSGFLGLHLRHFNLLITSSHLAAALSLVMNSGHAVRPTCSEVATYDG